MHIEVIAANGPPKGISAKANESKNETPAIHKTSSTGIPRLE